MPQPMTQDSRMVPTSRALANSLNRAAEYARQQGHRQVALEHLLLALTEDEDAVPVLASSAVDLGRLRNDVAAHLGRIEDTAPAGDASGWPGVHADVKRILEYAAAAAQQSRRPSINGAIVLAAIVGEGHSMAANLLRAQGMTFEAAIRALQRAFAAGPGAASDHAPAAHPQPHPQPTHAPPPGSHEPASAPGATSPATDAILAGARERVRASRMAGGEGTQPPPAGMHQHRPEQPLPPDVGPPIDDLPAAPPGGYAEPMEAYPASEPHPIPVEHHLPDPPFVNGRHPDAGPGPLAYPGPPPSAEDGFSTSPPPAPFEPMLPVPGSSGHDAPPGADKGRPPVGPPTLDLPPPPADRAPITRGPPASPPQPPRWQPPPTRAQPPPYASRAPVPGAPVPVPAPWPDAASLPHAPPEPPMLPADGNFAGAPSPAPEDHLRVPGAPAPGAAPGPGAGPGLQTGQLIENVPRSMQVGRPEIVEIRIARASFEALAKGMPGRTPTFRHDIAMTRAMSVRLKSGDGTFWIEAMSPETQWVENRIGLTHDEYASWRWSVTPRRRGKGDLQIIVACRTVGDDGLASDTSLPDQAIAIRVRGDYAAGARRWGGRIAAMAVGGALAKVSDGTLMAGVQALRRLIGI